MDPTITALVTSAAMLARLGPIRSTTGPPMIAGMTDPSTSAALTSPVFAALPVV
jgi:hypothetical protein